MMREKSRHLNSTATVSRIWANAETHQSLDRLNPILPLFLLAILPAFSRTRKPDDSLNASLFSKQIDFATGIGIDPRFASLFSLN